MKTSWAAMLEGAGRSQLETAFVPAFLARQRWFGGKTRRIRATRIVDWGELPLSTAVLALMEVTYDTGEPDAYLVFLATAYQPEADRLRQEFPHAIVCPVTWHRRPGLLHDATLDNTACAALLSLIERAGSLAMRRGTVRGVPGTALLALRGELNTLLVPRRSSAEQSNTSLIYGDRLILKLFRRQQAGPNPESEIGKYLTETAGFDGVPLFAGALEYEGTGIQSSTLAVLQGLVANEGDGWTLTLKELARYYENCAAVPLPEELAGGSARRADLIALSEQPPSKLAQDYAGNALDSAARLGKRTAELHLALAAPSADPAFSPELLTSRDVQHLLADLRRNCGGVFDLLRDSVARLPGEILDLAEQVLGRQRQILDSFRYYLAADNLQAQRTRIHGDYHLGQVLRVKTGYVILDFEGEPARALQERRAKHSPLKDVAGMLRSLSYAAYASLISYTSKHPEDFEKLEPWAMLWEHSTAAEFLRAYRTTAADAAFLPPASGGLRELLAAYWLDKLFYELSYELNNRPAWVRIPLMGILSLPIEAVAQSSAVK